MTLDAYEHQDMPFERLVLELAPRRNTGRSPLFQYFFNVQNAPFEMPDIDGLHVEVVRIPSAAAQFDISMTVDTRSTGTVTVDYSADLFDETTMTSLLESYLELLEAVLVESPSETGTVDARGDRVAAPQADPFESTVGPTSDFESPRQGIEQQLASIWEQELGVTGISRHDDFFELGGYSLLAVRIFNEIEQLTGRRPPMAALFRHRRSLSSRRCSSPRGGSLRGRRWSGARSGHADAGVLRLPVPHLGVELP